MAESDLSRPYVGYRSAGRRPERQQDRTAAANAPLAALRGMVSGVLGAPGDVESLVRLLPGLSEQTVLPTSEDIERRLPLRSVSETPAGRAFTTAGQLGGGFYSGPGSPLRAVAALPSAVGRAGRDFALAAGQPAVNVVKPRGGNWLAGSVEQAIDPLRQIVREPEYMRRIAQDEVRGLRPEGMYESVLEQNARANSINKWLDTKLAKYIRNEMGTPEDPVRALAERGVLHYEPRDAVVRAASHRNNARRAAEQSSSPTDFRPSIVGESRLARGWEDAADSAILPGTYRDMVSMYTDPESFQNALRGVGGEYAVNNPDVVAYAMNRGRGAPDVGFGHLLDELRNMLDPASGLPREFLLTPDQLGKVTLPQAIERVAKVNEWRAAQKAEANAALAMNPATQVVKEYPEGYKWVELTAKYPEKIPEGFGNVQTFPKAIKAEKIDAPGTFIHGADMNDLIRGIYKQFPETKGNPEKALETALKYEGDTMGHCVGGYCPDVIEGRSRIYSLRDAKGQPHVTVEVKPGTDKTGLLTAKELPPEVLADMKARNVYDPGFMYRFNEELGRYLPELGPFEPDIIQIKGKGNKAPKEEYLPFVQDFVRSQKWGRVGDLQNTGLYRKSDFIDEFTPEQLDAIGQGEYLTMDEIRKLREGKSWKPIDTDPELGINIEGMKKGGLVKGYQSGGRVRPGAGLPEPTLVNLQLYADTVARQMFPRERENEQRDAARHMLAAALAAQKTSPKVAELLGKGYEFKEAPLRTAGHWLGLSAPRADYETDIHNNALGIELGRDKRTLQELLEAVEAAARSGTAERTKGRAALQPDADTRYAAGGLVSAGAIPYEPAKIEAIVNSLREEINA